MDTPPTAIIDACVLYSAPVRDLIVRLVQAGLIHARRTSEIHDEWMRNVLKNNPKLTRERLERTRSLMDGAVRDCLVTGYADLMTPNCRRTNAPATYQDRRSNFESRSRAQRHDVLAGRVERVRFNQSAVELGVASLGHRLPAHGDPIRRQQRRASTIAGSLPLMQAVSSLRE